MSLFKGRRLSGTFVGLRRLEQLEGREVPAAILVSASGRSRLEDVLARANGDTDVLATSQTGQVTLLQSTATNLIDGQSTPAGEVNLFVYNRSNTDSPLRMVAPANAAVSFGGVNKSVPGTKLNAVLSDDGTSVAFISSVQANLLDGSLATGSTDAGGDDVFRWQSDGNITLVSRDSKGAALNGVTNPAISQDGQVVAFVSTAAADVVTGLSTFVDDRQYTGTIGLTQAGNSLLPLAGSATGSPDLFRAVPGRTPLPVSYSKLNQYNTLANSFTRTGPLSGLMHGDVAVDPLGRYMNTDGTGFVFQRTANAIESEIITYNVTTTGLGGTVISTPVFSTTTPNLVSTQGLWKYAFSSGNDPVSIRTRLVSTSRAANPFSGGGFVGTSTVPFAKINNAAAARQSLTTVFDYTRLDNATSFSIDNLNLSATTTSFTPGASPTQLFATSGNDFVMVSHTASSLTKGGNGPLFGGFAGETVPAPGGYALYKDGSRILFTSTATDLDARLPALPASSNGQLYEFSAAGTTLVSVATLPNTTNTVGAAGNQTSTYPSYNQRDGLSAAFFTFATNLRSVDNLSPNANVTKVASAYLYRRATRAAAATLQLLTGGVDPTTQSPAAEDGTVPNGFTPGTASPDPGRPPVPPVIGGQETVVRVYFSSTSTNLTGANNRGPDGTTTQAFLQEVPPQITKEPRQVLLSGGGGKVIVATTDARLSNVGGLDPSTQTTYTPFPGWTGEVRVAFGDINGDGTPDIICGAGPGGGPRVAVLDGKTGRVFRDFFAFEPRFSGGVYVAAGDLTGDGRDDLVIGAGEGGGPRVQILNGATDKVVLDSFVYESTFRGGVRVAVGNITNAQDNNGLRVADGRPDLVTAAGLGGGPRITVFDGAQLPRLVASTDFFAYEPSLRGGAYVSVGDYNFDGIDDIVTGAGPDGGPRVTVFSGTNIGQSISPGAYVSDPNQPFRLRDFFAFDPDSRTGARPVLKNVVGDQSGFADIVVGTGDGYPLVRTFRGTNRTASPEDVARGQDFTGSGSTLSDQLDLPLQTLNPFTSVTLAGAWVG